MVKHILNTSEEDFEFVLIGMNCPEDQYRLGNLIDSALNIQLELNSDLNLSLKGNRLFKFSLYHFSDETLHLEYFFVPNASNFESPVAHEGKSPNLFLQMDVEERVKLIKELPKTDYFLILKGEALHNNQFKIMDKLKTIPEIIQVQLIEANDLPSKKNLIF